MKILKRIFQNQTKTARPDFDAVLKPATPFYVIGDIHGCDFLLGQILDKILQDTNAQLVFVGDYVDRGEDSAGVIKRLYEMVTDTHPQTICLAGNHEDMLLQFIDNPVKYGPRWLKYGGLQTLASYGISGITTTSTGHALEEARDKLVDNMGEDILGWLRKLPTYWQNGNVAVVHAGADPDMPLASQLERTLKWGHEQFHKQDRQDGVWVIHGHNIVNRATIESGRVAIDTGSYATGKITAAYINDNKIQFINC